MKSVSVRSLVLVFVIAAFGCGKKEKIPAGVLSRDQMVKVLSEIYVTEDRVSRLGLKRDSATSVFNSLEGKVFEKTGVPDSVFKSSMDFYLDNPQQLEIIYSALVDSLNLHEQRSTFRPDAQ
jgi:hypothetical protein